MSKLGADPSSGISSVDVLILTERHPACRQRKARPGCCTECDMWTGVTRDAKPIADLPVMAKLPWDRLRRTRTALPSSVML
jgi:hypothetical protein